MCVSAHSRQCANADGKRRQEVAIANQCQLSFAAQWFPALHSPTVAAYGPLPTPAAVRPGPVRVRVTVTMMIDVVLRDHSVQVVEP